MDVRVILAKIVKIYLMGKEKAKDKPVIFSSTEKTV